MNPRIWCAHCERWLTEDDDVHEVEIADAPPEQPVHGWAHCTWAALPPDVADPDFPDDFTVEEDHAAYEYAGPEPVPDRPGAGELVMTRHTRGMLGDPTPLPTGDAVTPGLIRHRLALALSEVGRDAADQPGAPPRIWEVPNVDADGGLALEYFVGPLHGYAADSPLWVGARTLPEMLVEVADQLQNAYAHVDERLWPVCAVHDRGLHAALVDGEAVWRCDAGHVRSRVGRLLD